MTHEHACRHHSKSAVSNVAIVSLEPDNLHGLVPAQYSCWEPHALERTRNGDADLGTFANR